VVRNGYYMLACTTLIMHRSKYIGHASIGLQLIIQYPLSSSPILHKKKKKKKIQYVSFGRELHAPIIGIFSALNF
jgi:hypothetical protein